MYQHYILLACLIFDTAWAKDQWDDFADNLATDLAPFISLFGERLTKQFLSESVDLLDNFIFALAPLGILTALVSVIRVRGSSSLRAFVGRAQEGPGEAENELLSCVSETTGELFNDNGITRIFGRPRILEAVLWEDYDDQSKQTTWKIGTLRDALKTGAWYADRGNEILGETGDLPELDIPNLSLNKGIERRHRAWFICAAAVGVILQAGVIVYAAATVFLYPKAFLKDGQPVGEYVFPLFLCGTLMLCTGMFLCAFIIKRSSSECVLRAKKPSKLFWLQPGRQHGDQVFNAFLGCTEGSKSQAIEKLKYMKTVRNKDYKKAPLLFTACLTVVGFVGQFVGLRGLHATVILAQLGSTLVMAVIRTSLRTKRIGSQENRLNTDERQLIPHKKQELDCFAFHLERAKSFSLISGMTRTPSSSQNSLFSSDASTNVSTCSIGLGTRLIQTRTRLAELTSSKDEKCGLAWDDLPIRKIAANLADAIEAAMDLISTWKDVTSDNEWFDLSLVCQSNHKSISPILETYSIMLERSDDTLRWRVNKHELEAVIGLWTWSLLLTDDRWLQRGLGRLVGLSDSEARAAETGLYFHKWIFRQTEAKMVSSKMISLPQQMFGFYTDDHFDDKEVLVLKTENTVEKMVAQDIYIQFLKSAMEGLSELEGDLNILPGSHNRLLAHSSRLDNLVGSFESSHLGSREDGLLCIVPVLRQRGLLPELTGDSESIKKQMEELQDSKSWSAAFTTLYWLCERCEATEFEQSALGLGYLCRRAMVHTDPSIQEEGIRYVLLIMQGDPRALLFWKTRNHPSADWINNQEQRKFWETFSHQLGWLAWQIAEKNGQKQRIQSALAIYGISQSSIALSDANECDGREQRGRQAALEWLTSNDEKQFYPELRGTDDRLALDWVCQNNYHVLLSWLVARWVQFGKGCPGFIFYILQWAAEGQYRPAIASLRRQGISLEIEEPTDNMTPLLYSVSEAHIEALKVLLESDAKVDGRNGEGATPLMVASHMGHSEIVSILLRYGAIVNARDRHGLSPLLCATIGHHLNIVQTLLDHGADINMTTTEGATPLISAVGESQGDMIRLFLSRGADVNAQDKDGLSALMVAVRSRDTSAMEMLLDHGADVHQRTIWSGETALDWARKIGHLPGIQLLESWPS